MKPQAPTISKLNQAYSLKDPSGSILQKLVLGIFTLVVMFSIGFSLVDPAYSKRNGTDAEVIDALQKIAIVAEGYLSVYGEVPDTRQLVALASDNIQEQFNCDSPSNYECLFSVKNVLLPEYATQNACSYDEWSGSVDHEAGWLGADCKFRYYSPTEYRKKNFQIFAKSNEKLDVVYMYDSDVGFIKECDMDLVNKGICNATK